MSHRAGDVRRELGGESRLRGRAVGDLVDGSAHCKVDAARERGLERVEGELEVGGVVIEAVEVRARASVRD